MEPTVVDSTCLIVLDQIGRLDLLLRLFSPILIPPAVQSKLPGPLNGVVIKGVLNRTAVAALKTQMDEGEAEVVALSLEIDSA
jgi:predicted nucleic acid-binding protein